MYTKHEVVEACDAIYMTEHKVNYCQYDVYNISLVIIAIYTFGIRLSNSQ